MATTPEFNEVQLAAARKASWHQSGAKLVTLEEAREFVERFGLVAFAPGKLVLTAPSLLEATLGEANSAPALGDLQVARDLSARLTAEGAALPLNLLGVGGDTPDFLVSGAAFKYIYTLRGDKLWKQAPETSGSSKVTTLGLRVYETLTEKGAMTAAELANELGREVTEAAIVRALGELWQTLRVIPALQVGDGATMWELTNKRFTKAIKAGINAGQPTALSALVSMYLAQTMAASEDEIETFLSPVAARSRVREVVHALRSARELSEVVVAGKTLLHVTGEPLEMPDVVVPELTPEELAAKIAAPPKRFSETETPEPGRITKFEAPSAPRRRVPFPRTADSAPKREFDKPWDEGAKPRAFGASAGGEDRPKRPYVKREGGFEDRPKRPYVKREGGAGGDRPFRPRPAFGASAGGDRPKRPYVKREGGFEDRPKRPYVKREGGAGGDRPFRPRPAFGAGDGGDRPKRPYVKREGGAAGDRPFRPRPSFGASEGGDRPKRPYVKREGGFEDRPKRPYVKREGGAGGDRPFRPRPSFGTSEGGARPSRPYVKREGGFEDRPKRPYVKREGGAGGDRPFRPRPAFGASEGGDRPKRPYVKREGGAGGDRPFRPRPSFGSSEGGDRPKRPYVKREGGDDRPKRPYVKREGGDGDRPARKPFGAGGGGFKKPGGFGAARSGGGGAFKRAGGPGGFAGKPRGAASGAPRKPRPKREE